MGKLSFIATTLFGLEDVLAAELVSLGAEEIRKLNRAVEFKGSLAMMYKANLYLRTALRILMHLQSFRVKDENHLYKEILKIQWSDYFDPAKSFAVTPVINSNNFRHSRYIAQKVKDGIADHFRKASGIRPSVDLLNPSVLVNIHIDNDLVNVSLDSSGDPLFKRGYRYESHQASLNEVLAAGMIKITGWEGKSDFYDPMCGSGTIAIEATMIAAGIYPGAFRKLYSFFNWKFFDRKLFEAIKNSMPEPLPLVANIYASDISDDSIGKTKTNIQNAGIQKYIKIFKTDFRLLLPERNEGIVITNPPYGQRLKLSEICELYREFGNVLKHKFENYDAWIISANIEALKYIGLKPDRKIWLVNGNLKCRFSRYRLYKGSKKKVQIKNHY